MPFKNKNTFPLQFQPLRLFLGLFLLLAGFLKLHGLSTGGAHQGSFSLAPPIQLLAMETEILLGAWLLLGWSPRILWIITLLFFGVLAAASLYLGLAGQTSCGCFGRVKVSPWATFCMDIAIIAFLAFSRPLPSHSSSEKYPTWLPFLVKTGTGTLVILLVLAGGFLLAFDNPLKVLNRLRGESVTVDPSGIQVGDGFRGEQRMFFIHLRNQTDHPIRIIGGTADCSCIATNDLPVLLLPDESRAIQVGIKFSGTPGLFQRHFILFTDDETQKTVVVQVQGRLVEPAHGL